MNIGKLLKRDNLITLILTYISGIAIYSLLITQRLVNTYDGIWAPSFYASDYHVVTFGRFVWPYLDFIRGHVCDDPYMSLLSLFIFSVSLLLADLIVGFGKWLHSVVFNLMFIANVVVCVFLSYRFMSPTFAFSVFFSILAVFLIKNIRNWIGIVLSGVSIMLTMGLYQANIGVFCVMVLLYIVVISIEGTDYKTIGIELLRIIGAVIIGAILYIILCKAHLKLYGVEMTSYAGADTYSVGNTIVNLPKSVVRTYSQFVQYFFKDQFLVTVYQRFKSFILLQICFYALIALIIVVGFRKDYKRALILLAAVILLPVASNAILIAATKAGTSIQMTAPSAFVMPCIFAIVIKTLSDENYVLNTKLRKIVFIATIVVGCVFVYSEALQVCIDQSEMLMSTRATTWMYNETIDDLKDEDLLDSDYAYCYLGKPSENPLFLENDVALWSNTYSHMGDFWINSECEAYSYHGVMENLGGVKIKIAEPEEYEVIREKEEIKDMPIFPEEGYIKVIDDYVVVNISNNLIDE